MTKHCKTKTELLLGSIRRIRDLMRRRNLVIFIGRLGVTVTAFKNRKVIDSIFIAAENQNDLKHYTKFLKKYRTHHIKFLLDTPDCQLGHETMPIIQTILKSNPVEKFIAENHKDDDVVAYNVYDVVQKNSEVWQVDIASLPYTKPISTLLEYIIHSSFKFAGIYFLALEFPVIIEKLLEKSKDANCREHLQIFAAITQSSDIKLAVKHKNHILAEDSIEYPGNKSDSYIQGTIEQAISDKILLFKDYASQHKLKICIIFLCDDALGKLLRKLKFDKHKIVVLSGKKVLKSLNIHDQRFQDNSLMELFNNHNTYIASNHTLKSISKLTFIGFIIFKPLIIAIIVMLATLASFKYQTIKIQNDITDLNRKYYNLSEQYRDIKNDTGIKNIGNVAELYNLESLLDIESPKPFNHLKSLLSLKHPHIRCTNIEWAMDNKDINFSSKKISIIVDLQFIGGAEDIDAGTKNLNSVAKHIKSVFQKYQVKFIQDTENIILLPKKTIIPAKVIITGTIKGGSDAG